MTRRTGRDGEDETLRANLRHYPWFIGATNVSPWMPVFFLFFSERVGLDGALTLSAIYYAAVVALEVPSGYASDRFGRRPILIASAATFLFAYVGFCAADDLPALAFCQVALAAGRAFRSGSDSALLHDTLAALGREDEYGAAEARAATIGMNATGVSCLIGGLAGSVALVLPYALAAAAAAVALAFAIAFREPPLESEEVLSPALQRRRVGDALGDRVLAWLFTYYVLAFALAHVPFELYQPWLRLLGESGGAGEALAGGARAPIVSGAVFAVSMFGGALGSSLSIRIAGRLGLAPLLLLANAVQLVIIAGLALALHPVFLVLVLARNFAMGMSGPPMLAAIAPRLDSGQRATWLSLQSLAGRLGFSLVLFTLSRAVGDELDWPTLRGVLIVCALVGAALALIVHRLGARDGVAREMPRSVEGDRAASDERIRSRASFSRKR